MLHVEYTNQFKRDIKLAKKRNKKLELLRHVMHQIASQENLPTRLRDHSLSGPWSHHRELHIEPDWLLIYKIDITKKTAVFVRTGSHADLFD